MELPSEILKRITDQLDVQDLQVCTLVSRQFHIVANPRLYSLCLGIKTSTQLHKIMATLDSNASFSWGRLVLHLKIKMLITNKDLLQLATCTPALELLELEDGSHITDKGLNKILKHLSNLKSLSLSGSPITVASIRALGRSCHGLTALRFDKCPGLGTDMFDALVLAFPGLQELDLDGDAFGDLTRALMMDSEEPTIGGVTIEAHHLAYKGVFNLAQLQHLTSISIRHAPAVFIKHIFMTKEHPVKIKDRCAIQLGQQQQRRRRLPGWPKLTTLALDSCIGLFDLPTIDFFVAHPQIENLVLHGASISNSALRSMGNHLHQLSNVRLSSCPRMTARGIRRLVVHCKHLKHVEVEGSGIMANVFPEVNPMTAACMTDDDDGNKKLIWLGEKALADIRRNGIAPSSIADIPKQRNEKGDANDYDDGMEVVPVDINQVKAFSQYPSHVQASLLDHGLGTMNRLDRMYGANEQCVMNVS